VDRRLFNLVALLLVCSSFSQSTAFAQRGGRAGRKPETSSDSAFDVKSLNKLAVLVVGEPRRAEIQTDQQRRVEDEFVQVLLQKGHTLVSRSDVAAVVKEQKFQRSGLTEDNAAAIGKLLSVPAVLVLRITECGADAQMNSRTRTQGFVGHASLGARLISVETGSIWWTGTHNESGPVRARGDAILVLADVAKNLALAFPDKGGGSNGSSDGAFNAKKLSKLGVVVVSGGTGAPMIGFGRPRDEQTDQQRLVEDEFVQALMQKGYSLVSRSDIQAVVKEQGFQTSGLTEDNAVAIGKLLNVPAVLVVRITDYKTESQMDARTRSMVTLARASLGARLVSVESGQIWWTNAHSQSGAVGSRGEATRVLAFVAKKVAGAFPDKNATPKAADSKAGKKLAK
jgi:hypothetical protein